MNFTPPTKAKKPFSLWGTFRLSPFAKKIRDALGMRLDDDYVQTTYREDYNDTNGTATPDTENICHHFEQAGATADAVKISVVGGSALRIHLPNGYTGNVIEIYEADSDGDYPSAPSRKMNDQGVWS